MTYKTVDSICREAISCRSCFQELKLPPAAIDIAQPRWVGPQYWSSPKKIVAIMLNPGSGNFRNDASTQETLQVLHEYKNHKMTLADVFQSQFKDMPAWGRGRFLSFFQSSLGLNLDTIAFMNLAWCATANNSYPKQMLSCCFERHGLKLLKKLSPDVVLLCGSNTHSFSGKVAQTIPQCQVIPVLHYAHREGSEREVAESDRIKPLIHGDNTAARYFFSGTKNEEK